MYRFSYTLRVKGDTEGSFTLMEWYNGDYRDGKEKPEQFTIEYNPNKSGSRIYKEFCYQFIFKLTDIVQFDLAYDIPGAKASDIIIDTRCDIMTYGKTYNKTTYISPKEDDSGRIKIYDKRIERESQGISIEDTLRIEITIKGKILSTKGTLYVNDTNIDIYSRLVDRLNSVKIKTQSEDAEDWKVYALSCLTPEQFQKCLGMMSKNIRSNYKKKIENSTYYTLGLDVTTLALHLLTALAPWQERMKI